MLIKIEPLDTLFFRTGKPFTMQQDNYGETKLLPPLSTLRGALRAHYFRHNPHDFPKANTNEDPTLKFKIYGLYYLVTNKKTNEEKLYVLMPADLVQTKKPKPHAYTTSFELLNVKEDKNAITSSPYHLYLYQKNQIKTTGGTWLLEINDFISYLQGKKGAFAGFHLSKLLSYELKTGIRINPQTRTTLDGHLYNIKTTRYENKEYSFSLLLDIDISEQNANNNIFHEQYLKLGGEGKLAIARTISDASSKPFNSIQKLKHLWETQTTIPSDVTYVKLILQTPLPLPPITGLNNYETVLFKAQPLTATMPKPVQIGGFDMKTRTEKPMITAIPSQATFYFDTTAWESLQKHHANSIAINENDKQQGYGITFIGVC